MFGLGAVEPNGFGVGDGDSEDRLHGRVGGDGEEAGEEAGNVRHDIVDGDAGVVKCRLDDRVVLWGSSVLNRGWEEVGGNRRGKCTLG